MQAYRILIGNKAIIQQMGSHELKIFSTMKKIDIQMKQKPTEWYKILSDLYLKENGIKTKRNSMN